MSNELDFDLDFTTGLLCQQLIDGGKSVLVNLYPGDGADWHLEVIGELENAPAWNQFFSHQEVVGSC